MVKKRGNNQSNNKPRKRRNYFKENPDKVYFEGIIKQGLPGTKFKVEIGRGEEVEPLLVDCELLTKLKNRLKFILGDKVKIEYDITAGIYKIVERL